MAIRTIETNRTAPAGNQWQEALSTALVATIGADKCTGCGTNARTGKILFYLTDLATADDENTLRTLINGHDTNTRTATQTAAAEDAARKTAAKTTAAAIPAWAAFTEAEALAWLDAHVSSTQVNAITTLAEAKAVLADMATLNRALVQLVVALRDHAWPELPREV